MRETCTLRLSDGNSFSGQLIGAPLSSSGELVFTTGMVGYSEALTDPSYFGQILVFTYPLIGNYGVPSLPESLTYPLPSGFESKRVHASAAIVTLDSPQAFHWNSFESLDSWLKNQGVPGIVGLDTRHLVHLIRHAEKLLGSIEPEKSRGVRQWPESLGSIETSEGGFFDPEHHQIIQAVSTEKPIEVGSGDVKIAVIDCGVKWNIVRQLADNTGCRVQVVPWDSDLSQVECDGWLISNGPGDPMQTGDLVERVQALIEQDKPILGICLGHQILSRAAGAKTRRMAYGHRSHNQPVYEVGKRKGYITTQNHGYVVEDSSLSEDWEVWFRNVNDETVEGIRHKHRPISSIQFHPEAAGGPRDTAWILEQFVKEVTSYATA